MGGYLTMAKKKALIYSVLSLALATMAACSNQSSTSADNAKKGNNNQTAATQSIGKIAPKNVNTSDAEFKAGSSVTVFNPKMSTLDPTQWQGQILEEQGTLLEGLYGYNQDNEIVPKIATGYTTSKDGRTWTFKLRKDAKWSNGDPVTANDFYASYMYQLDPKNATGQYWLSVLNNVQNSYAYHAGAVKKDQVGLKVVDDYTLQITTTVPHAILGELVLAGSMPINENVLKAHPTDWFEPQNFVSNGPYIVKSFKQNSELVMVKNPNYVGTSGQLNHGNVETIHVLPATTVPVEDYMAGKTDVALVGSTSDLQYVKSHKLKDQLYEAPTYSIKYLEWTNPSTKSPYDNLKVRQAISKAIQRDPIVSSVLSGMGGATTTFSTPGWPTEKHLKGLSEDINAAKKLLKEAGYANGKGLPTLTLYIAVKQIDAQGEQIAMALGQELQENLGIKTEIKQLNEAQYNNYSYFGPQGDAQPGFILATGATNWSEPASLDMGGTQQLYSMGTLDMSQEATKKYVDWSKDAYYKPDFAKYGDPNDKNVGVKWSDWAALEKAAQEDIAYIEKWTKEQPADWQPYLVQPGVLTAAEQWKQIEDTWKNAKTNDEKHAAFVSAWSFVAPTAPGARLNMNALDVQVFYNKNESNHRRDLRMWQAQFVNALTIDKGAPLAAKVVDDLTKDAYSIPLFYQKQFYLFKSGITGVQANPWAWGNFYGLQYLNKE